MSFRRLLKEGNTLTKHVQKTGQLLIYGVFSFGVGFLFPVPNGIKTMLSAVDLTQWSPPSKPIVRISIGESLRGNRIGATGLRASERKSERGFSEIFERFWEGFRGFQRFSEVLRGFQRFLRGFQSFLRGFQRSSQRPSQRQISSQRLSVLLPLIVLPLELSPIQDRGRSRNDRGRSRKEKGKIEEIAFSLVSRFWAIFVTLEFVGIFGRMVCADGLCFGARFPLWSWIPPRPPAVKFTNALWHRNITYETKLTDLSLQSYEVHA